MDTMDGTGALFKVLNGGGRYLESNLQGKSMAFLCVQKSVC